jgi:hypothetical protein
MPRQKLCIIWDEDKSSRYALEALRGGAVPPFQTSFMGH